MFLFCNEDRKKKERLNSLLQTTRNLIKNNEIKDVRKNPVYSLIRAMSNYHLYDIVRELYEDEEVTDVQSIYKDIGEYLINSNKLNNCKSFELGESNINIDLSKDAILVCAWNKQRFVDALLNIGQNVGNSFEYDKTNHMATYIFPIGLTIVYNGNHSTYDYMYFDGIYFRNKINDEKLYKVERFEIGALYEIGRLLAENGIR